jgi:hypothetical protein
VLLASHARAGGVRLAGKKVWTGESPPQMRVVRTNKLLYGYALQVK